MFNLSPTDLPLQKHAERLLEVLKSTEDITLMTPLEKLTLEHRIKEDLGLDSIQTVSILYELEVTYPHLTEEMVADWKTLRDIIKSMAVSE